MRKWNFCAGPAAIPEEVLKEAQNELLEWNLSGSSVMEVSHRSDLFAEIAMSSIRDIKTLLNIEMIMRFFFCRVERLFNLLLYH